MTQVKTHVQMGSGDSKRMAVAIRQIWQVHGVRGFFRGSGSLYFKYAPHTALMFLGIEFYRDRLGVPVGS